MYWIYFVGFWGWLWAWLRLHFSDVLVGIITTVIGVWLGYVFAVQQDLRNLRTDAAQREAAIRAQEESVARSILQEFQTNCGIADQNIEMLQREVDKLRKHTFSLGALADFYEGVGPHMYGALPRVFQSPDSVRHRVKTIAQGVHWVNNQIRLREQIKVVHTAQPMSKEQAANFYDNLLKLDQDLIASITLVRNHMIHPDTIWHMATWPADAADKPPRPHR